MGSIRLKFVKAYVDRHGRARHYFRVSGRKNVSLPGSPGSPEFNRAYEQAFAAAFSGVPQVSEIGARRTRAGSINAMIVGYLGSADFAGLATETKPTYRRILEGIRRDHGDMSVATLKRQHVVAMLDAKKDTPAAGRSFLKCLRLICKYAIDIGIREENPTAGLKVKQRKTGGHVTWTEQHIVAFRNAYRVGTKPRLAMELLLGTALRCADVVKLGRGHVHDGVISITKVISPAERAKVVSITAQKTNTALTIPVTAELAEAIYAAAPTEHVCFLVNQRSAASAPRSSGSGSPSSADALGSMACRRTGSARRHAVGWPRPGAPRRRLPPSARTPASPRCSATLRPPTARVWLAMRWLRSGRKDE